MGNTAPERIPIPKLSRIEHYQNLVQAWDNVYVGDLHELLPDVKVLPRILAEKSGWTPEKAFEPFEYIIQNEWEEGVQRTQLEHDPNSNIGASQSQIKPSGAPRKGPKRYKCLVSGFSGEGQLPSY